MQIGRASTCWVSRATGERVVDWPHPLPTRWRDDHAWHIDTNRVRDLAADVRGEIGFVAGTVENEADAWDLFDHVICLVIDDETLRHRLATRTANSFGKDPVELEMALAANRGASARYRNRGAAIIDATQLSMPSSATCWPPWRGEGLRCADLRGDRR